MTVQHADAVVVGAGPNGLVAAAQLARAGWDVVLCEATDRVGGAVASAEIEPGVVSDRFSAFYPLAAASPIVEELDLHRYGLHWVHAPAVLGHLASAHGTDCAVLERDPEATAAALDRDAAGDGQRWLELFAQYRRLRAPLLGALFTPFPPLLSGASLLRRLGTAEAADFVRFALLPGTRMVEELFRGESARLLLLGNAAHADVPLDAPGSGMFGWLLAMLGQDVGFPVPRGGAGRLSQAMADAAAAAGAQIRTGLPVSSVLVRGGRATGVRTAAGEVVLARRAVLADVPAPLLYRTMLPAGCLPTRVRTRLSRFEWDLPTVKVNWSLSAPVPWRAAAASRAGCLHLGGDRRGLLRWSGELSAGDEPRQPFLLVGQMTTTDPTRSPHGTESLWAYSHLPRGCTDPQAARTLAERMETVVAEHAPGFRDAVRVREVQTPADLQRENPALVDGAVNGGTAQLHQQLIFRPFTGLGRPETPVAALYLASAGAHPGGGVHGAAGSNAARAAMRDSGVLGPAGRVLRATLGRLVNGPG